MKKIILLFFFINFHFYYTQCNNYSACNPNSGVYSQNNPEDIEYDNFNLAFHTSFIKDPFNNYKIWGALAENSGIENVLSPKYINNSNYPNLVGEIKKVAIGSYYSSFQLIVLSTEGLFVSGKPGTVISATIKADSEFNKISVDGKLDGLPYGVSTGDVKMMFASYKTLIITTCTGEVFVLSELPEARGNGNTGSENKWSQVMENATTPLTNVIVTRGQSGMGFALKNDGTIWTWGEKIQSGISNQSQSFINAPFAIKMALPNGITGIKMIQVSSSNQYDNRYYSYYLLDDKNTLYCIGYNGFKQLGFSTSLFQKTWLPAKYSNGNIMNNIAWISTNEHDPGYPAIGIITTSGVLYTAGSNSNFMLGSDNIDVTNFFEIPNGILPTDFIITVEVGGHCTAVTKKGTNHYGYVGHRIDGSMGNGSSDNYLEEIFDFEDTPIVDICGVTCTDPIIENNGPVCYGKEAVFTIKSTPNDNVTYSLNNGTDQKVTIDKSGKFEVKIPNSTQNQNLHVKFFKNDICDKAVSITSNIQINQQTIPEFNQLPPICFGETYPVLPTTSINGISGTWTPVINNSHTATYTFTPNSDQCASIYNVTIPVVNNSNIYFENLNSNTVNVVVTNGVLPIQYQLLNEEHEVLVPWQNSSSFTNLETGFYYVEVRTESTACITSKELLFINLPNVITPNADGINDHLDLSFMDRFPNSSFDLYDRHGKIVMKFNTATTFQSFEGIQSGNYWYVLNLQNGTKKFGWVLIKKR